MDALYAELPEMHCQGFCHDSCGPIGTSVRERARITEHARKPLTCDKHATCSMLTADRKCGVYEIRPLICRLWGVVKSMPCPYGCVPEGGHLPDAEGLRLMIAADAIGGSELGTVLFQRMVKNLETLGAELVAREAWRGKGHAASLGGRSGALPPEARPIFELPQPGETT